MYSITSHNYTLLPFISLNQVSENLANRK